MSRVGYDGFVILWSKSNPTRYKKIFCNPTQPTKPKKPTQPNGSDLAGRWVFCTPLIVPSIFLEIIIIKIICNDLFGGDTKNLKFFSRTNLGESLGCPKLETILIDTYKQRKTKKIVMCLSIIINVQEKPRGW